MFRFIFILFLLVSLSSCKTMDEVSSGINEASSGFTDALNDMSSGLNEWAENSRKRSLARNSKKYVYTVDDFIGRDKIRKKGEERIKKEIEVYKRQIYTYGNPPPNLHPSNKKYYEEMYKKLKIRYTAQTAALYSMLAVTFNQNYEKPEYETEALYYLWKLYSGEKIRLQSSGTQSGSGIVIKKVSSDVLTLQNLQVSQVFFAWHYNKYISLYRDLCKKDEIILSKKFSIQSELDCVMRNKRIASDNIIFSKYAYKKTIKSLKEFIKKYPKNVFVGVAQARIHYYEYAPYKAKNTIASYKEFIKKYPKNPLIKEAKARFNAMEFEPFAKTDTEEGYFKFIKKYPKNMYVSLSWDRIWNKYKNSNDIGKLNLFIKKYQGSPYKKEAKSKVVALVEERAFKKARKANTEAAYLSFFKKYPNTLRGEVYYFLKYFKAERTRSKSDIASFGYDRKHGVTSTQISSLMESYRQKASSTKDWAFLYGYTNKKEDLARAYASIKNRKDERALVESIGEKFFRFGVGNIDFNEEVQPRKKQSLFNEVMKVYTFNENRGDYVKDLGLSIKAKSIAKYGTYKVYFDLKIVKKYLKTCAPGTILGLCNDNVEYTEEMTKPVSLNIKPNGVLSTKNINLSDVTVASVRGIPVFGQNITRLIGIEQVTLEFKRVGR